MTEPKLRFVHYGLNKFDKNLFEPICNHPIELPSKPSNGGYWGEIKDSDYTWKEWCVAEDFPIFNNECENHETSGYRTEFELIEGAKVLYIKSPEDVKKLPTIKITYSFEYTEHDGALISKSYSRYYIDYDKIANENIYDAIVCHYIMYRHELCLSGKYLIGGDILYGWEVDSILVINPDVIKIISEDVYNIPIEDK